MGIQEIISRMDQIGPQGPLRHACILYVHECANLVESISQEIARLRRFRENVLGQADYDARNPVVNVGATREVGRVVLEIASLSRLVGQVPRDGAYKIVSEWRRKLFTTIFEDMKIEHIHSRAARNSLEHFEERVDRSVHEELKKGEGSTTSAFYAYGLIVDDFPPPWPGRPMHSIKFLHLPTLTYTNFGASMELPHVEEEVIAMRSRLIERLGTSDHEGMIQQGLVLFPHS